MYLRLWFELPRWTFTLMNKTQRNKIVTGTVKDQNLTSSVVHVHRRQFQSNSNNNQLQALSKNTERSYTASFQSNSNRNHRESSFGLSGASENERKRPMFAKKVKSNKKKQQKQKNSQTTSSVEPTLGA